MPPAFPSAGCSPPARHFRGGVPRTMRANGRQEGEEEKTWSRNVRTRDDPARAAQGQQGKGAGTGGGRGAYRGPTSRAKGRRVPWQSLQTLGHERNVDELALGVPPAHAAKHHVHLGYPVQVVNVLVKHGRERHVVDASAGALH